MRRLLAAPLLVAVLLSACGGGESGAFTLSLSPQTLSVERGSSETVKVTLSRSGGFDGDVTVTLLDPPAGISAGPFTLSGSATSAPLKVDVADTVPPETYNLTVRGAGSGLGAEAPLPLTVSEAPSPPLIESFNATPAAIAPGGASTLSWQVSGATNVSIAPEVGVVAASGSAVVSPQVTTTYTLTASNEAGSVEAITVVAVEAEEPFGILVFSKTAAYRHASIPHAVAAIEGLGEAHGFAVDATEDAALFTDANLARYSAVVFLSTTGEVLNDAQQGAFERYIRAGGGFVGVHSASDTGYRWPWYGELVGTYFADHPPGLHDVTLIVEDPEHPSTSHLPERWARYDEWYNFETNPRGRVNVLLRLDTTSYEGSTMGDDHPIAWYHGFDGGRSWYTGLGHTEESYREPLFLEHLLGGIHYAAGR